jgi:hypothetical protein
MGIIQSCNFFGVSNGLILLFMLSASNARGSSTKDGIIDFVLAGAILLVLLYKGRSDFSESENAKKYSIYSQPYY